MTRQASTRSLLLALALAFPIGAAGCDSNEDLPDRAAEIAREIRREPSKAEEILESHDLTIEEFETMMYEIAGDPEQSERYQAALTGEAAPVEREEGEGAAESE